MGEQRLHHALAPIDLLTRLELEQVLGAKFDAFTRDFYRGKLYIEENGTVPPNTVTSLTIPGPDSGYSWALKLVSVNTTGTAGVVNLYLGDNTLSAPIGSITQTAVGPAIFTFTSNIVVFKDQRNLTVTVSAGTITGAWKILAQQVPTEMEGKL